jgi:DNA-binding NtrC family response regulator
MTAPVRIMLVEDLDSDVDLTRYALRRAGINAEIRQVLTEQEFRSTLQEFDPQLVISDFSLPRFDGLSALAIARTECPSVPFIFMSGTIGSQRARAALEQGAAAYVQKGDYDQFVAEVRRLVPLKNEGDRG